MLKRRVVRQITDYLEPREIFNLITQREWSYSYSYQKEYGCRDRSMMALAFSTAGRITVIVGGDRFQLVHGAPKKVGTYDGLTRENLIRTEDYILVKGMKVAKRSQKIIAKYGDQVQVRPDFIIPLKRGLFENPYWDQLVPFAWLVLEYLVKYAPRQGKLFQYKRQRAWQIISHVTGKFPNWFRSQAENFYGHYLLPDSVKLAKFLKIVRPEQTAHYIGYSWKEQLKDKEELDFEWIEKQVAKIKGRLLQL